MVLAHFPEIACLTLPGKQIKTEQTTNNVSLLNYLYLKQNILYHTWQWQLQLQWQWFMIFWVMAMKGGDELMWTLKLSVENQGLLPINLLSWSWWWWRWQGVMSSCELTSCLEKTGSASHKLAEGKHYKKLWAFKAVSYFQAVWIGFQITWTNSLLRSSECKPTSCLFVGLNHQN